MSRKAKEIYEAGGRYYPVDGYITSKAGAVVPLVGIPQMSDEKWQKAAARNAVDNYTREHGKPPESSETALKWQCQKCEKTNETHKRKSTCNARQRHKCKPQ